MGNGSGSEIVKSWPDESREAAQIVLDTYGEPDEATASLLIWYHAGPWKRVVASKAFYQHDFPAPHVDCVQSFVDYRVPVDAVGRLAEFDGSVVVDRTAGELSARCHDEQANFLALNLAVDIVEGAKTPQQAREYYAQEFADYRRKKPTPYMDRLRLEPQRESADPDERMLSDEDLRKAQEEGESSRS